MDEPAQTQGSPNGPRRSSEPTSQTETAPTAAIPPPLPDTRIEVPPSRRPPGRRPARRVPAHRMPARRGAGGWDDPRILLAMLVTVLALPALLLVSRPDSTKAEALSTEAEASVIARSRSLVASTTEAPTTLASTTSEPAPASSAPTTEAAPPTTTWSPPTTAWSPPTTAWSPPTTAWSPPATTPPTTAWVPPPTTAAPAIAAGHSESGEASWYDWRPGECAHKTIPKGTVVTIHASNGNTATCVVTDRGPFGPGRIIDLDRGVFAQLTSPGTGVIAVTITW